jgi:hypothetical protein
MDRLIKKMGDAQATKASGAGMSAWLSKSSGDDAPPSKPAKEVFTTTTTPSAKGSEAPGARGSAFGSPPKGVAASSPDSKEDAAARAHAMEPVGSQEWSGGKHQGTGPASPNMRGSSSDASDKAGGNDDAVEGQDAAEDSPVKAPRRAYGRKAAAARLEEEDEDRNKEEEVMDGKDGDGKDKEEGTGEANAAKKLDTSEDAEESTTVVDKMEEDEDKEAAVAPEADKGSEDKHYLEQVEVSEESGAEQQVIFTRIPTPPTAAVGHCPPLSRLFVFLQAMSKACTRAREELLRNTRRHDPEQRHARTHTPKNTHTHTHTHTYSCTYTHIHGPYASIYDGTGLICEACVVYARDPSTPNREP